jgi:site-specific DNA recombinase
MQFAFYGRVSTEDLQDPQALRMWQLSRVRSLIEPAGGEVVAEFFDLGVSRSLPWKRRPEALRLLASDRPSAGIGVLGRARGSAQGEQIDPDLMNAGRIPVTELPGSAYR